MNEQRRPWLRAPNFGDVCAETLRGDPDRLAMFADGREFSYAQLVKRARRFAGLLPSMGVGPGDTVALATGNDWRFIECLLGTLMAGAVALLVNVKLSRETLAYISGHSEAKLIVADATLGDRVEAMAGGSATLKATLAIGDGLDALDYDEVLASARPLEHVRPTDPDSLALLMYTSGSTGRPKGCMLSHSNTWWQARSSARCMLLDRSDKGLVMGPLYHANALWAILLPMLFVGGGFAILRQFERRSVLEAIQQHGITYTSGTPSMYSLLLADPEIDRFDLSSIQLLQCGSAPVPGELMTRIKARFKCDVVETYGLTEAGANVLTPRWGIKKLGSTGLPVPDVEVKITAPDDPSRECGPGEIGELWSRSPANAMGYLHEAGLTAERFWPGGWMRTGDLMRRDEQGYCYFCGRTDDMISVGGENVYPKEVETIVLSHPAVGDVAVVPASHPVKGQAPVAFVVLKAGARATEEDIKQHFLKNGPAYAHPRRVFFTDALPMSTTNKLDRGALKVRAVELLPQGLESKR
ncbi:MAG: class I adenylate-forming enzyme family protein [Candidatus Dormibacteria bacterium]